MASPNLVFLFILFFCFHLETTKAAETLHPSGSSCSGNRTTPDSPFQLNVRTLFNYLSSNATIKEFHRATVHGANSSDTAYGMFMCRGDIPSDLCAQCVSNATHYYFTESRLSDCFLSSTEGYISYEECMVRYSNSSFNSTADSNQGSSCARSDVSPSFEQLLWETINKTAEEAASSPIHANKYYATKQARTCGYKSLYTLAQCTPDMSPEDCRNCLNDRISETQRWCRGEQGEAHSLGCYIKFGVHPFYRPTRNPPPAELVPAAKSHDSGGASYISHKCSTNATVDAANGAFTSNLRTLLFRLYSKSTSKTGFYKTQVEDAMNPSDTVNGLLLCRGDVSPALCQRCVQNAADRILSECGGWSKEGIIWYNHCFLRYSYQPFSLKGEDTSPSFQELAIANDSDSNSNPDSLLQRSFFTWTLANTLSDLETATRKSTIKNYATVTAKLNDLQTLYALAQCTPDLDNWDCIACLRNIFREEIPWCCMSSPEGKVMYPSCYMMFGLSKFYGDADEVDDMISQVTSTVKW